jgi:hypothetical protein
VASVDVPTIVSVPLERIDDVAVIFPTVSVLIVPLTAFKSDVKKLLEVAFVVVRFAIVPVAP